MNIIIITPAIVKADPRYQQQMSWPLTFKSHLGGPHPMPMWNLGGVDWFQADPPPRKHKHWAQTVGQINGPLDEVWRCSCGAFGDPYGPWVLLDKPRVSKAPRRRWFARASVATCSAAVFVAFAVGWWMQT